MERGKQAERGMAKNLKLAGDADRNLMIAAKSGDAAGVRAALEAGADPGARDGEGTEPLHLAAWGLRRDVSLDLMRFGADPEALDGRGRVPKDWAEGDARFLQDWPGLWAQAERERVARAAGPGAKRGEAAKRGL